MTAPGSSDTMKQLRYLAAALKAPRITEAAQRLAGQARDAGWTATGANPIPVAVIPRHRRRSASRHPEQP